MIGIMVAKLSFRFFRICKQGGLFPTPAELVRYEKMNRKYYFFFKVLAFFLVCFPLSVVSPKLAFSDEPLIIDHTCTDIAGRMEPKWCACCQFLRNPHDGHSTFGGLLY